MVLGAGECGGNLSLTSVKAGVLNRNGSGITGSGTEGRDGNSGDADLFLGGARKVRPRRGWGVPLLAGGLDWERCCLRLASLPA